MKMQHPAILIAVMVLALPAAGIAAAGAPGSGQPGGGPLPGVPTDPISIATGPDSSADGYLEITADEFGSWAPFGEIPGITEDLFNPAGPGELLQLAFTDGFFVFVGGEPDRDQRILLSTSIDWQGVVFDPEATLFSAITEANSASDTDGDGINDTLTSAFRVDGEGTALAFELTQTVRDAGGGVAVARQDYTITNESADLVSLSLVRAADGDLLWEEDFSNDEVGTSMWGADLGSYVFQQEPGIPGTSAVTVSSLDGTAYYGGKNGVQPEGGPPAYGFGTDIQVWEAFGVPDTWVNHIAGVGYETNGTSGPAPPGVIDPEDGFIGLEIPVDLDGGASQTITVLHTYGANEPNECLLGIDLARRSLRAGDRLVAEVLVHHNRQRTVTVPIELWIEDGAGREVHRMSSPPHTFHHGDIVRQRIEIALPSGLTPGRYRLVAGIGKMQQKVAYASQPFRVVAAGDGLQAK